uniref:Uncharacterized protein n=1 Tax=Ralstonia syzygii R24 TaxID=907261 RepID=G3ACD1_9RALS|nr:hypothetical protein RALSY_mp30543 [Ralstonia syzygii R24]
MNFETIPSKKSFFIDLSWQYITCTASGIAAFFQSHQIKHN